MDEIKAVFLIDACNVVKTIGFRKGTFTKTLKWLIDLILLSPRFDGCKVEVVVDNTNERRFQGRRTESQNGHSLDIVSCSQKANGQVTADHYIRNFIGSNKDYTSVAIVTDDKELKVSILNEVYKGGFDIEFINVKSFIKRI